MSVLLRAGRCLLLAYVVVLGLAPAAAADVRVATLVPRGDGSVDLVLTLDGGCTGSPTTGLATALPEGTAVVAVQDPDGWSHEVEEGRVSWTGPAIPAQEQVSLAVTARLDAEPGETVPLPTLQSCADGTELSWDDAPGGELPAPMLVASAATVDASLRPAPVGTASTGAGPVAVAATVTIFVALVGGVAVVRRRRFG